MGVRILGRQLPVDPDDGPQDLDPKEVTVSDSDYEVTAKAHAITTINVAEGSKFPEIELSPETSRNYEIFIDNTEANRSQLPIILSDEGAGLFVKKNGYPKILSLPVSIKVKEPRKNRVLLDVETIDDGYEWNPTVTNIEAVVSTDNGFSVGDITVKGKELQFLTNASLTLIYGEALRVVHQLVVGTVLNNKIVCNGFSTNAVPTAVEYVGMGCGYSVTKPLTW